MRDFGALEVGFNLVSPVRLLVVGIRVVVLGLIFVDQNRNSLEKKARLATRLS